MAEAPAHTVVLLCSANRKSPHPAPAWELYRSEFFRLGRSYALRFEPTRRFVLSAEHGLLPAGQEVAPYTMTMSALGQGDVEAWAQLVVEQLYQAIEVENCKVIVLGLRRFAAPIAKRLPHAETPLVGMTLAQAMNFLREKEKQQED